MSEHSLNVGSFHGMVQDGSLLDGFERGPSAAERANEKMTPADDARMSADWAKLRSHGYYQKMSPDDQRLLDSMFEKMELASRGSDDGARMTRKALDRIVSGEVHVTLASPVEYHASAVTQGTHITVDRTLLKANELDAAWIVGKLVHEDSHVANRDGAGGIFRLVQDEYRGHVEEQRASDGLDPTPAEAIRYIEGELLGEDYRGEFHEDVRRDPEVMKQVGAMEKEIAAGKVGPSLLGIPEAL